MRIPLALLWAGCQDPHTCETPTRGSPETPEDPPEKTPIWPDDWGFADLHAHPAIQLSFGADSSGKNGIIHGDMGGEHGTGSLSADLPSCDGDKHGDSYDAVNDAVKAAAFSALDGSTGGNHLKGGAPGLVGWPDAQSITHQQMHTEMVHRAWQGGMRLMVASATDNKLLSKMWTIGSWSTIFDQMDQGDQDSHRAFDKASAEAQLDAIRDWVDLNEDWAQIVTSSEQLGEVMAKGKLAVLLAVEMDSLSAEDILSLYDSHDVRLVTPIHLANNPSFGGMAVYSDLFNASNETMHGENVAVSPDNTVRWRYANPRHLSVELTPLPIFPLAATTSVSDGASCALDYELCEALGAPSLAGQVNADGLYGGGEDAILSLMRAGLIVDLAHMSDASQDEVLSLAESFDLPVVDTHTDIRPALSAVGTAARQVSERSLSERHLARIGALGGIVGLGTEGHAGPVLVERISGSPLEKLVSDDPISGDLTWTLNEPKLVLGIQTGDDDLRDDSELQLVVTDTSGASYTILLREQGDDGPQELGTFGNNERDWLVAPLPAGLAPFQIDSLQLRLVQSDPGCETYCDNWKLSALQVFYVGREEAHLLYSDSNVRYLHYFRANDEPEGSPDWEIPIEVQPNRVLTVELWTGEDDLRCGASARLDVKMSDGSLWTDPIFDQRVEPYRGLPSSSYILRPIALPEGVTPEEVESVGLTLLQGACEAFTTSDNWNIDGIKIVAPDDAPVVLVDRSGWPFIRLSESDPEIALAAEPLHDEPLRTLSGRYVRVGVKTGTDDIQDGAFASATLSFGGPSPGAVSFDLNEGAKWGDGYFAWRVVDLGQEVDAYDLEQLHIHFAGQEDDWKVASLQIELLSGPIGEWLEQMAVALAALGDRGVALGTDLNGLAPQVPYSEVSPIYPLDPPSAPSGYEPLQPQKLGERTFDFSSDGLSNYGALPDFLGALEAHDPDTEGDTLPLFRSAADFRDTWAAIEAAAANIP